MFVLPPLYRQRGSSLFWGNPPRLFRPGFCDGGRAPRYRSGRIHALNPMRRACTVPPESDHLWAADDKLAVSHPAPLSERVST